MNSEELFIKFEGAERKVCLVSNVTYSNSAFASTTDGDTVFINARIVETMRIKDGDWLICYVLPNYEDKRANCPFRTIRAERMPADATPETAQEPEPPAKDPEPPAQPRATPLERQIIDLVRIHGPLSTKDLSDMMGVNSTIISNNCRALHRSGVICRADVFRIHDQKKASIVVWASHPKDFYFTDA